MRSVHTRSIPPLLFAWATLLISCNPLSSPPPVLVPATPPPLLGCDSTPFAAHCPQVACNPGNPAMPTLPFSCPGNGTTDTSSDDIDNLYGSFSATLQVIAVIQNSRPEELIQKQKDYDSSAPVYQENP